jgi:hypothetical protein
MICKLGKGQSFPGIVRYTLKPDAAVLQTEGIRTGNSSAMSLSFTLQSRLNTRVRNPVGHHILSCAPQDEEILTDDLMLEITNEYLQRMGILNTQLLIVRHHDRKHPHVHIVFNRIDNNGKTISDRNDRYRAIRICKDLTREYGLHFGLDKKRVDRERLKGADAVKYYIFDRLEEVRHQCRNWDELAAALKKQGIEVRYKYLSGTSEIQGVSFCYGGYSLRGSKIDRSCSFKNLSKLMEENSRRSPMLAARSAFSTEKPGFSIGNTGTAASVKSVLNSVAVGSSGPSESENPSGKKRRKDWEDMSEDEKRLASKGYSM